MRSVEDDLKTDNLAYAMDIDEITRLLPHRRPILLVDRVDTIEIRKRILARRNISVGDPIFEGHFPGQPIYPGVYIVEGLAQASGLLTFKTYEVEGVKYKQQTLLTSVENVRFRKMVRPGDVLYYNVHVKKLRGAWAWFKGQAEVDGEVVAEAEFSARTELL